MAPSPNSSPTASPRAGAGPLTDATDQVQRGLIIRPEHACKFFQPDKQGRLKTMELRQHNLRCVPQGGCFWVVACGQGKNDQGVIVFKLLGCVQFEENVSLNDAGVRGTFSSHLCPEDEFEKIRGKWKKKDAVVGWRVSNAQTFDSPKYIKPGSQDWERVPRAHMSTCYTVLCDAWCHASCVPGAA